MVKTTMTATGQKSSKERKALVIIPSTKITYQLGFSAPVAWLFSAHAGQVQGCYGFELNDAMVRSCDTFILELNWFLDLREFTLIAEFIKSRNPRARILFGGLFSSLMYRTILNRFEVDYHIRGDNELPMRMFLDGMDPRDIPNMAGRDFENPIDYIFQPAEFHELTLNLDWFPSYFKYLADKSFRMSNCPLPLLTTSRGGCSTVHSGCDHCMGAQHDILGKIYGRPPVIMDNQALIALMRQMSSKFRAFSLFVLSPYNYDFSGERFPGRAKIEIDSPVMPAQVANIYQAFEECDVRLSLYREGVMGETLIDTQSMKEILALEDAKHRTAFYVHDIHQDIVQDILPGKPNFELSRQLFPEWGHWNVYSKFEQAETVSRNCYDMYRRKGFPVFQESLWAGWPGL